jgi:epoxyqueuosine reductase
VARTDTTPHAMASLGRELVDLGIDAGLTAVGITTAERFEDTRLTLEQRKAAGLHGGMAFTYRNPARSTDPGRALVGARSLVVGALGYLRDPPDHVAHATDAAPRASVARYSWEDHYEPLRRILGTIAERLDEEGWRAKVLVDDNALVDRAAAHRAGIGWFGKNTTLLLPGHGSWFVLGSVVTDAALPPTPSAAAELTTEAGCGTCTRCMPACPTGALVAPGVLDARRCLAWLLEAPGVFPREHRVALGGRIYGCDDCQEVCPPNRLEERRSPPASADPAAEPWVDLLLMLAMTDEELIAHFGRWYIAGRDPTVLRRNALLALANVADPGDARVRAAVEDAARDRRPLVRAHAVWAAARLGYGDVVDAVDRSDDDPMVRDEVGERPPPRTR